MIEPLNTPSSDAVASSTRTQPPPHRCQHTSLCELDAPACCCCRSAQSALTSDVDTIVRSAIDLVMSETVRVHLFPPTRADVDGHAEIIYVFSHSRTKCPRRAVFSVYRDRAVSTAAACARASEKSEERQEGEREGEESGGNEGGEGEKGHCKKGGEKEVYGRRKGRREEEREGREGGGKEERGRKE